LCDDLNTPKAIAALHELHSAGKWGELRTALALLGFSGSREQIHRRVNPGSTVTIRPPLFENEDVFFSPTVIDPAKVQKLVELRSLARTEKDFAEADRIRDELAAMNVILKDAKDPKTGELVTTWEVAR
jgi:cysteinyl-tRNA synthetase